MSKRKINPVSEEQKMTIQLWLGAFLTIFGVILLIVSFCVPPLGVIDASVLAAVGEVFTFSGALIGIDYSYKYKRFKAEYTEREEYNEIEDEEHEDRNEENIH